MYEAGPFPDIVPRAKGIKGNTISASEELSPAEKACHVMW